MRAFHFTTITLAALLLSACARNEATDVQATETQGAENTQTVQRMIFPGPDVPPPRDLGVSSLTQVNDPHTLEAFLKAGLDRAYSEHPPFMIMRTMSMAETTTMDSVGESAPVSETNTIEQGVDEADRVKYLNNHLYMLNEPEVFYPWRMTEEDWRGAREIKPASIQTFTVRPDATHEARGNHELHQDLVWVNGFYAYEDSLLAVGGRRMPYHGWNDPLYWQNGKVAVEALNVAQPERIQEDWTLTIDGDLVDSRRVDNYMVLVSRFSPALKGLTQAWNDDEAKARNTQILAQASLDDLLPSMTFNGQAIAPAAIAQGCYLPLDGEWAEAGYHTLTQVTVIDLNNPEQFTTECAATPINGIYQNREALYLLDSPDWNSQRSQLHRFDLTTARPTYYDSYDYEGALGWNNPEFRIREHNHVLTMVTTEYVNDDWWHRLINVAVEPDGFRELAILPNDREPERIGKPRENVQGVRITDDRAFIVTFERTDPLYVIDITQPDAPYMTDAYEETGFSDYLHKVADDILVGIGFQADLEGVQTALKVSLYDASVAGDLRSVYDDEWGGRGSFAPVLHNHHALTGMAWPNEPRYRMAFPVLLAENWQERQAGVLLYDITTAPAPTWDAQWVPIKARAGDDWTTVQDARAFFYGDAVHLVWGQELISFPWQNPSTQNRTAW